MRPLDSEPYSVKKGQTRKQGASNFGRDYPVLPDIHRRLERLMCRQKPSPILSLVSGIIVGINRQEEGGVMVLNKFESAIIENDRARLLSMITNDPNVVTATNEMGITPLVLAVARGTPETVELLINHGAEINKLEGAVGSTSLITAVMRRRKENVAVLLRHGAKVDMKDRDGRTALDIAIGIGYDEIAKMLTGEA